MTIANRVRQTSKAQLPVSVHPTKGPESTLTPKDPEIWGGVESTVNRVHDTYFDQTERTGHASRPHDIEAFAELGITSLRYPVLWERCQPDLIHEPNWQWTDERLALIRSCDIRPVAGLLHHGSGPQFTDLLDDEFAVRFAAYARAVAHRYPWLDMYVPINEPGTTARFSTLYGYWYPHHKSDRSFATAIINQSKATVLAMREIKNVNPAATLIQTEDLGRTWSTGHLQYQADFQNERRWLALDLISGNLAPGMPMWDWLLWTGIQQADLTWFLENNCVLDVVGINYYPTSDRFLDHRTTLYDGEPSPGNGLDRYVDISAVGVPWAASPSVLGSIQDAWARYRRPIAITEVHLGSSVDEQVRWLNAFWNDVQSARAMGMNVIALTAWALTGMYDWHCLVQRDECRYEPGVFDASSGDLRATRLAAAVRDLAKFERIRDPAVLEPGWWTRTGRYLVDTND